MAKAKNTDKLVVQNAAKTLLANIRFASVDDPIRTITVTSSIPNEGKSTVSINLAQAIATSGKSVLLVETDMRRRSLSDMLGVRSRGGLYAVLSEQISIDQAIVETGQKNLLPRCRAAHSQSCRHHRLPSLFQVGQGAVC